MSIALEIRLPHQVEYDRVQFLRQRTDYRPALAQLDAEIERIISLREGGS